MSTYTAVIRYAKRLVGIKSRAALWRDATARTPADVSAYTAVFSACGGGSMA